MYRKIIKNFLGNMMLIMRGDCSFLEKALKAQATGASSAIIFNNEVDDIDSQIDMVDDGSNRAHEVDIPVMWIGGKNGHMILNAIRNSQVIKNFNL